MARFASHGPLHMLSLASLQLSIRPGMTSATLASCGERSGIGGRTTSFISCSKVLGAHSMAREYSSIGTKEKHLGRIICRISRLSWSL